MKKENFSYYFLSVILLLMSFFLILLFPKFMIYILNSFINQLNNFAPICSALCKEQNCSFKGVFMHILLQKPP